MAPGANATDTVADPVYDGPVATVGLPIVGACGTVVAVNEDDVVAVPVALTLEGVTVTV